MSGFGQKPPLLAIAAAVLIGHTLVLFAAEPSLVRATSIAVAAIVASLLVWRSRLAWVVVLVGAVDGLISPAGHYATQAVGAVVIICLLAPPSVRFVWTGRPHRQPRIPKLRNWKPYERLKVVAFDVLCRLAGWDAEERDSEDTRRQRSYSALLWSLGVGCVVLLVVASATHSWQKGTGGDDPIVNVIASASWGCYALVQLAFIAAVIVAVYRHVMASRISH